MFLYILGLKIIVDTIETSPSCNKEFRRTAMINFLQRMYNTLIQRAPNSLKINLRKFEKTKLKLSKAKWSVCFNETCLTENILPNHTKISWYLGFVPSHAQSLF